MARFSPSQTERDSARSRPNRSMSELAQMRYKADIAAGALKLPESRLIADLLLRQVDAEGWRDAIVTTNVLRARNPATARRLTTEAYTAMQMSKIVRKVRDRLGLPVTFTLDAC